MIVAGGGSGHAEGTTRAAASEGTLTVRDTANQQQDVADLSRDAEHANGSISPIFDKEKEQRRLQEVQLIAEIGSQAADIARTQGEINGLNAARAKLAKEGKYEPGPDASREEKAEFDGQHKNHLEVFDSKGKFKAVLNLDGTINQTKTEAAKGRKI